MSRAIENYICASEDRSHYNNETDNLYGFHYPMRSPEVTIIQQVIKTETVSDERLLELINERLPELKETVLNEIVIPGITTEDVDAVVDEIHGGSALDAIEGGSD